MTDESRERPEHPRADLTRVEAALDAWAHRHLSAESGARGARRAGVEFLVFILKQAWACVFGALMLAALVATALWYPDGAALSRNDALVLIAVAIQVLMVALRLESGRELWVIVLFHLSLIHI